jgi:hypothetical protein
MLRSYLKAAEARTEPTLTTKPEHNQQPATMFSRSLQLYTIIEASKRAKVLVEEPKTQKSVGRN